MTDPHEWLCAQARVSLSSREPKPLGHFLKATPCLSWGRTQTHVTVRATTCTQTTHFRFWAVGHVWYWTGDTTHRNQKLMQRDPPMRTRKSPLSPHLMPTMTLVYKFVFSSTSFKLWHLGAWVNTVPNTLLSLPLLPWGFCFIKISVPPCAADMRLRIIKKLISTFLTLISRMFWLPLEMNTGFSKCLNTGLFT